MKYKYNGQWVDVNIKALDSMEIGSVIAFAGDTIPNGWLECDGSTITQSAYPELYALIGGTLPNFKGRTLVGKDSNDTDFDTLLETGGSKYLQEHKHLDIEIASNHLTSWNSKNGSTGIFSLENINLQNGTANENYLLTGNVHETQTGNSGNLQPYAVINWIIKATNTTPTMASVVNATNNSTTDAYSCDYVNGKTGVELWTNENPTSSFSAQDINIDLSSYSYIEVLYRNIIADPFIQSSGKIPVGYGNKTINHTWINGEGETLLFRVLRTTTSKVAFETGYSAKLTDATINTHNDCLIPYKIIGYK